MLLSNKEDLFLVETVCELDRHERGFCASELISFVRRLKHFTNSWDGWGVVPQVTATPPDIQKKIPRELTPQRVALELPRKVEEWVQKLIEYRERHRMTADTVINVDECLVTINGARKLKLIRLGARDQKSNRVAGKSKSVASAVIFTGNTLER